MPLSSSEIAQMNGAYQQQSMSNQQYSGMIGQGYGSYGGGQGTGQRGDAMMGGMMNRGSAYGAPLLAGAAGLMGLDPMSMGMKVGMGAFAGGAGFGGAALAGGAVALPLMGAVAGMKYAGSQMYAGAQNQMALNDTLRGSFTFQNRTGGQGFDRGSMSGIGEMMHGMAQQMGPGGELTSMKELTSLAGKMGTMGFAQGVRDVQDFTKRFKEMTTALKSMAKDLGTTMEGAMEFAAASKGSGIFGMSNMSKFSHQVRGATVGGNLGVSEVTGMANIGSQIARSVGGLGRQGAGAGIRTIGQIGAAQQMGLLSEEDIYNQTGLTGAEGRQAMATSALSKSASFLQSGKGRRMLASIAGKDGTLDEAGIQQLMSGSMTISQTMQNDKTNLGKIGRANFIRNEGRLRGAAMERLGGFLPAMQLQEWAQGKGIDINNMDGRSMLFAQRQLGMGRDEVDNAVKMANNMPMILEQMRSSGERDSYFQKQSQQRKTQGLEGIKGRFEHAKQLINGKLEKAGADIFNQGSESIDNFFNKLLGDYVDTYSKDIDSTMSGILSGGASGVSAGKRLGLGVKLRTDVEGVGGSRMSNLRGSRMDQQGFAASMTRGTMGGFEESFASDIKNTSRGPGWGRTDILNTEGLAAMMPAAYLGGLLGGKTGKYMMQGQSDVGRMRDAGFEINETTDAGMRARMQGIQDAQRAVATSYDPAAIGWGVENKDWISKAYAQGDITGKGEARTAEFGALVKKNRPGDDVAKNWDKMTEAQKASFAAQASSASVGGDKAFAANYSMPDLKDPRAGGYGTLEERNVDYANAIGGVKRSSGEKAWSKGLGSAGVGLAAILTPGGIMGAAYLLSGGKQSKAAGIDRAIGSAVSRHYGTYQEEQEMGRYAASEEYRDYATGLMSSDPKVQQATEEKLRDALNNPSGLSKGQLETMQGMDAAADYMKAAAANGGKLAPEDAQAMAEKWHMSLEQLQGHTAGMADVLNKTWKNDMSEIGRRMHESGGKEQTKLAAMGIYDAKTGGLTAAGVKDLQAAGGMEAVEYATLAKKKARLQESMGSGGTDADAQTLKQIQDISGRQSTIMSSMNGADKVGSMMAGTEMGAAAAYSSAMGSKFNKGMQRRGATTASVVNDLLGAGLSKDELKGPNAENLLVQKYGLSEGTAADLHTALQGQKGGGRAASDALGRVMGSDEVRKAKAKESMEKAEANDPLSAAIKKNGEKTNELLAKIAVSAGQTVDKLDQKDNPDGTNKVRGKETGKARE